MVQSDEVHSGGSYLSQNDLRLHFGLGASDRIDKAEIIWPSGKVDTIGSLPADRIYGVEEGKGIIPAAQLRPSAATQR
jgi:hypothetical protein